MSSGFPTDYYDHLHKSTSWELIDFINEGITVQEWDDESLLQQLHSAASKLSYHNAAEGDCWRAEAGQRQAAFDSWRTLKEIAMERGIWEAHEKAFGHYLI